MSKMKSLVAEYFEESMIVFIVLGILAIAFLVHYKFSFLNFFFLPVVLSAHFLGRRKSVFIALFCVFLVTIYLILFNFITSLKGTLSFDDLIRLITWGSFLILTAAVIGGVSEQRESKLRNMRRAYVGVLDIMLKYLEVADEVKPRSLRVSILAGKVARTLGLSTAEVENIKSAALLYEAGDLQSSLPLFEEVADFIKVDMKESKTQLADREEVMLKTTASLLKEIEPILAGYFHHYVEEVDKLDKNLEEIPIASSIIALADVYDRISSFSPPRQGTEELKSLEDIERLSGRAFPVSAVQALVKAISPL